MAASEIHLTVAQAQAIAESWSRRAINPVTVRQEDGDNGDIRVWLPNFGGTKQELRRIKPDGRIHKATLSRDQKAAVRQSKRGA